MNELFPSTINNELLKVSCYDMTGVTWDRPKYPRYVGMGLIKRLEHYTGSDLVLDNMQSQAKPIIPIIHLPLYWLYYIIIIIKKPKLH